MTSPNPNPDLARLRLDVVHEGPHVTSTNPNPDLARLRFDVVMKDRT